MGNSSQKARFPRSYHLFKCRLQLTRCRRVVALLKTTFMTASACVDGPTNPHNKDEATAVVTVVSSGDRHWDVVLFVPIHTASKWRSLLDSIAEGRSQLWNPLVMGSLASVTPYKTLSHGALFQRHGSCSVNVLLVAPARTQAAVGKSDRGELILPLQHLLHH